MPSSLFGLGAFALSISPVLATTYNLVHNFDSTNFFQNFSLTSGADPTHGFVEYLDYDTAQSAGLVSTKSGNVYLGTDHTNTYSTGGRPSTRVESNVFFDQGLMVADFAHIPGSACGVWPAFWTVGSSWPADGEIDIIEGVNNQATNSMVLHTQGKCDIVNNAQTGQTSATKCALSDGTTGCVVKGTKGSFGDDFNALGGGVYAMEWTSQFIKIWFFPRDSIPASITAGKPDPSDFGTPMGDFQGSCNIGDEFKAQKIVINTDFCGDWAGGVFGSSGCTLSDASNPTASCNAYVGANPAAFVEAYWEIKSIKIYEQGKDVPPSSTTATATIATTTTTTKPASTTATTPKPEPTTTTTMLSTSTKTTTRTLARTAPSSSARVLPSSTPCPSKTTLTVTSFTTSPASTDTAVAPASSKLTTTTIVTTSYVDICPSGYTTKTITHTVTYCPADTTSGGVPPGFTTTSKACATGCGSGPTTVVVTVPTGVPTAVVSATATRTAVVSIETQATSLPAQATTTPAAPVATSAVLPGSSIVVPPAVPRVSSSPVILPSSSVVVPPRVTSSSTPGSGSSTTTGVSPLFTNAAGHSKQFSMVHGLIVALAGAAIFI
ncbi:concanavalin A-like lectin/glucanase domain-containing protein [Talaromyces proteolyticus]|uniref:endo-1,3(4)-beta-glucanase n=1 Tax=Talaromyces proteolyticus TaxID=1131652 RepID=A0AAD4KH34_9EURO|nr:concanavalin A-like lectin/glucanase domain-containing protein [Talaromyces proteolyticus]KAH8690217.1 concanavalin A-like lectin/glucanase domain-containing protein [Talaromyces proteolyticus]